MPDNVTVNEAVGGDAAPPLSVSNWPGETAAATPPADPGTTGSDATPPPADSGTPPATTETPPAEGDGGEAGAGDTPLAEGEGAEPGEGAAGEGGEPPAAAKPDKSLSGRLSKATRERNEERERADQLAGLLEKAIEKLGGDKPAAPGDGGTAGQGGEQTPPAVVEPPGPRPRRDAFDDPDAYDEAVDAWSVKQATKVVKAEIARQAAERQTNEEQQRQRTAAQTYHAERVTAWNSQVAELKKSEDYADFDDLLTDTTVSIAAPVSAMLLTLPQGAKVFHHLGHHKAEAEEISKLALAGNHNEALRRLHRIEYQLENVRPQVSKTPPPIKPLGNSNRAAPKAAEDESMEEYAARRTPAIQAERKGVMFGNRRA